MLNKEINQDIKNFLKKFEGRECFILTNFGMRYLAHNLQVGTEHISFQDKFGINVLLSITEIAQVKEFLNGN
jgi:hypothetical protein